MVPERINPRRHQPPVGSLGGLNADELRNLLKTLTVDFSYSEELANYASEDCERFMQTIHLIPNGVKDVLEVGASPYFTTVLAKWFRSDLDFKLTNYFGPKSNRTTDNVAVQNPAGDRDEFDLQFLNVNVENEILDLPDECLDVVLFCEVIEHMTNDPVRPLLEFWRVLEPNGYLVMTTPNAARLENVARLMAGHNMYDPYSGYGPYGRHNREYTRHELFALLTHCGFSADIFFSADVNDNRAADYYPDLSKISTLLEHRNGDLGQYHFMRWRKSHAPSELKPSWLYRSYPANLLDWQPL